MTIVIRLIQKKGETKMTTSKHTENETTIEKLEDIRDDDLRATVQRDIEGLSDDKKAEVFKKAELTIRMREALNAHSLMV